MIAAFRAFGLCETPRNRAFMERGRSRNASGVQFRGISQRKKQRNASIV